MAQVSAQAAPSAPTSNTVSIKADRQQYDPAKKLYRLDGRVTVKYKDIVITGTKAHVDIDEAGNPKLANFFNRPTVKHFKAKTATTPAGEDIVLGDVVKLYLKDNQFGAEGNVISHINTVAADPFVVRSDTQLIDNNRKIVTASGQVKVDYQGSVVYSNNALMRMNPAGKADRVIFTGDARLLKDSSEMTGERITVEVASGNLYAENNVRTRVDLKEKQQGPDKVLVYSDYQNYDKASSKMLASGHVKILYGDYVATGPKATFNIVNGSVDKIFLTGRSTIIEQARKVTADKITITTNPKNFDAVGNVQTQFQTQAKPSPTAAAKPAAKGQAPKKSVLPVKPSQEASPTVIPDNPLDYQ